MEFIVLILALATERYLHVNSYIYRFNWFGHYLDLLQKIFSKTGLFSGCIGLTLAVAPIFIAVAIVYYLLGPWLGGFVGFILSLAILIYCLGPKDMYTSFEAYFVAVVRDDKEAKQKALQNLLCVIPENEADIPRTLTKSVFSHFNYSLFTVVFWYIIFGPLAPVLYRTIAEVHKAAHMKDSPYASMSASAAICMSIIEWLPLRIIALLYALVGDFHQGFNYWFKNLTNALQDNYAFSQECGLAAMGIVKQTDGSNDVAEVKSAIKLVDRSLILYVVIVALIVLGAVIY